MKEKGVTLARSNPFMWEYDEKDGIKILRNFGNTKRVDVFSNDNISKIINYVKKSGKVRLSNNVERLKNGTEMDGLGKFVFDEIQSEPSYAQSMSQFAAIMVALGILEYNGARKSMEFWVINEHWQKLLINRNK